MILDVKLYVADIVPPLLHVALVALESVDQPKNVYPDFVPLYVLNVNAVPYVFV